MSVLHRFFNFLWYRCRGYRANPLAWLFWPLAWLFGVLANRRREAYETGQKPAHHAEMPVIIVGNITVGGTGKTPLTIWLIEALQAQGWKPGVVSRGYGGKAPSYPHRVSETDAASVVGDEPLMIHLRTGVPVVVDPNRAAAAQRLVRDADVNVIISDDGLQHYALARTVELVVVDGARGFGNQGLLPMGPLREPLARLKSVDAVIINGKATHPSLQAHSLQAHSPSATFTMTLSPGQWVPLNSDSPASPAQTDRARFALAGIGNPQRFFDALSQQGVSHTPVPFPDHHDYSELDLEPYEGGYVLTTEKDAVKLRRFESLHGAYLPIDAQLQSGLIDVILARLEAFNRQHRHRY